MGTGTQDCAGGVRGGTSPALRAFSRAGACPWGGAATWVRGGLWWRVIDLAERCARLSKRQPAGASSSVVSRTNGETMTDRSPGGLRPCSQRSTPRPGHRQSVSKKEQRRSASPTDRISVTASPSSRIDRSSKTLRKVLIRTTPDKNEGFRNHQRIWSFAPLKANSQSA